MKLITSESVTEGHPDKVCDRLSDSILDAILAQDPTARVAVECLATTGMVHVAGEVTTSAYVEIPEIVRKEVTEIGYTSSDIGFDGASCGVSVSLDAQSADIAGGVNNSIEARKGTNNLVDRDLQGAGDQGIIFGYASDETPDLMPAPLWLAHKLAKQLTEVRKTGMVAGLRPDGKTQVTLGYQDGRPITVDTVVVSSQHNPDFVGKELESALIDAVVNPVLTDSGLDLDTSEIKTLINPSGRFVTGGPVGDCGLTGRKIIVDTYGGAAPHGGGAFSGKDPSKVDRSAAYMARWAAKTIVATGVAKKAELQVAYAIGQARPVGMYLNTFGTAELGEDQILRAVEEVFDFRPAGMIADLDLLRPIYKETAAYGHFGRSQFPWESLLKVAELNAALKN